VTWLLLEDGQTGSTQVDDIQAGDTQAGGMNDHRRRSSRRHSGWRHRRSNTEYLEQRSERAAIATIEGSCLSSSDFHQ